MRILYYPGCTLKAKAKNFEDSSLALAEELDIEMVELPVWNCCGTVFSLAQDNLMHQIAPIRNLVRVRDQGEERMTTLCAMCYNTLKRANQFVQKDVITHKRINNFLDNEIPYNGEIRVIHLLEILRDEIGFENLGRKIKNPLGGLKVAPYYGCLLLRPEEVGLDNLENPRILEDLIHAIGGIPVQEPLRTECCGAYQTVNNKEIVAEKTYEILGSSISRGAEAVITSCPLCQFNLDFRQKDVMERHFDFERIPVLYFSQLLALALGRDADECDFELNYVDPKPLLINKGLIQGGVI